jgi:hypothetical protein
MSNNLKVEASPGTDCVRSSRFHCTLYIVGDRTEPCGTPARIKDCQSESYVTIEGQWANLSWCQAPIWDPRQDFYYSQIVAGFLMWGALSGERAVCRLQLLLALASAVILGSDTLLPQIRVSPNLEGQVPVFTFPTNRTAQLHPHELGSLFVASYDSQGYGGDIRTRLHGASKRGS